jgi:hypothetical protein
MPYRTVFFIIIITWDENQFSNGWEAKPCRASLAFQTHPATKSYRLVGQLAHEL